MGGNHINNQDPHIKLTVEEPKDVSLVLLGTKITVHVHVEEDVTTKSRFTGNPPTQTSTSTGKVTTP